MLKRIRNSLAVVVQREVTSICRYRARSITGERAALQRQAGVPRGR
jgi:hypothetical protein